MSRNNEARTGATPAADTPPEQMLSTAAEESPSPMQFTTPTEFVDLPSRGRFYSEDSTLHGKESIEIRYMTAKDEDILTSKSLLKKGLAIDRLLQNILVDKTIRLSDMLIGDKNALVVAARISGYGSEYNTKVTCPACSLVQQYEFDLDEQEIIEGGDSLNATPTGNGTWVVDCPKSGVKVEVRLLTGADEKWLTTTQANRKKNKLPESTATDQLKLMIKSVNGDEKQASINKFINSMPAQDARFVRSAYEELMPDIDLSQHFDCQECGFDMDMEVPFTTDFFCPKR